jgi:hypothetical protein
MGFLSAERKLQAKFLWAQRKHDSEAEKAPLPYLLQVNFSSLTWSHIFMAS